MFNNWLDLKAFLLLADRQTQRQQQFSLSCFRMKRWMCVFVCWQFWWRKGCFGGSDSVTATVVIWRQASHKADSIGCRSLLVSIIDGQLLRVNSDGWNLLRIAQHIQLFGDHEHLSLMINPFMKLTELFSGIFCSLCIRPKALLIWEMFTFRDYATYMGPKYLIRILHGRLVPTPRTVSQPIFQHVSSPYNFFYWRHFLACVIW